MLAHRHRVDVLVVLGQRRVSHVEKRVRVAERLAEGAQRSVGRAARGHGADPGVGLEVVQMRGVEVLVPVGASKYSHHAVGQGHSAVPVPPSLSSHAKP